MRVESNNKAGVLVDGDNHFGPAQTWTIVRQETRGDIEADVLNDLVQLQPLDNDAREECRRDREGPISLEGVGFESEGHWTAY